MSQFGGIQKSFRAGADLNTSTTDFQPVRVGSAQSVLLANSTTHKAVGVLQNRPKSGTGSAAWVQLLGPSKLTMNDTCSAGDLIIMGSGGAIRGTAVSITTADRFIIGYAFEASALTGTVIEAYIDPDFMPGSAAAALP